MNGTLGRRGSTSTAVDKTPGKPSTAAFAGWTAIGACVLLALLTPFTIGAIAALVALAGVAALLMWPAGRSAAAFGALSGAGAVPLYVAWLNRDGPGTVCNSTATHCVDEWSPWGWFAIGLVLITTGVATFMMSRRSPH